MTNTQQTATQEIDSDNEHHPDSEGPITEDEPVLDPANPANGQLDMETPAPRPAREAEITNALLNLERESRKAETESELGYLMVNGSRVAVQYRQAILLLRNGTSKHQVTAVSSLSAIDRNSTFIRWIERIAKEKLQGDNLSKVLAFDVRAEAQKDDLDASSYPFGQLAILPLLLKDGTVFGHLLFTRENDWDERSLVAAARLCETYSHSWESLIGPSRAKRRIRSKAAFWLMGAALIAAASFYPVPLTVLAPAEVTPRNARIVSAPIDGVIESIEVDPNTLVKPGDKLFSYSDTELRNRVKIAGQAVGVAEARYQQSLRSSFADPTAKRELSIAQSELQLKASEYDYAKDLLDKSAVSSKTSGLVIFDDKDSWTGRPVATGERIMRIADPSNVEVTVNVPVADAIVLQKETRVQLYLDSAPLKPLEAQLKTASFHARPDGAGVLSYRVTASLASDNRSLPRIGLRGTAQIYGDKVSLAYFLFRKPLSVVRQWTGY